MIKKLIKVITYPFRKFEQWAQKDSILSAYETEDEQLDAMIAADRKVFINPAHYPGPPPQNPIGTQKIRSLGEFICSNCQQVHEIKENEHKRCPHCNQRRLVKIV